MKRLNKTLFLIAITCLMSACSGPFADYTDQELKREFLQCDYSKLSPAGAQRCRNIEKECKLRKEETGFRC